MSDIVWTNERRKLSALIPWPRNPRQIKGESVRRLQESFEEFGQPEVIAISPAGDVYNGHQRLKSWAAKFGDIEVDVRVSSRPLTEKEREKLTVLLHRGAVGSWDFETLANEFEVDELLEWGFEEWELGIDAPAGNADAKAQIDRAAELNEKWQVQPGDLWRVGEHRLICGDCTDRAVVERVMGGDVLDLIVTDPPYGVAYADKNKFLNAIAFGNRIQTHIKGDHGDLNAIAEELWRPAFQTMHDAAREGAVIYCTSPQGGDQMMMMMMMMQASFPVRHELIWIKNNHVLGRADYQYKHEPILYAWKGVGHKYYGGFQTSLIEVNKPQASKEHPTMKPVGLFQKLIENSSLSGEIVGDWFSGSGTTMVACENLGRRCRAVEIAPGYVAVALERMATAFPGIVIERVSDDG